MTKEQAEQLRVQLAARQAGLEAKGYQAVTQALVLQLVARRRAEAMMESLRPVLTASQQAQATAALARAMGPAR